MFSVSKSCTQCTYQHPFPPPSDFQKFGPAMKGRQRKLSILYVQHPGICGQVTKCVRDVQNACNFSKQPKESHYRGCTFSRPKQLQIFRFLCTSMAALSFFQDGVSGMNLQLQIFCCVRTNMAALFLTCIEKMAACIFSVCFKDIKTLS